SSGTALASSSCRAAPHRSGHLGERSQVRMTSSPDRFVRGRCWLVLEAPMAIPKKRIFFFLFAVLVLGASPALSVPLSSGLENPGAAAYGTSGYTDQDGETTLPVDGTADQATLEARIVDHKEVAMSSVSNHGEEGASHSEVG